MLTPACLLQMGQATMIHFEVESLLCYAILYYLCCDPHLKRETPPQNKTKKGIFLKGAGHKGKTHSTTLTLFKMEELQGVLRHNGLTHYNVCKK